MSASEMAGKSLTPGPSAPMRLGWQVTSSGQPRYWLRAEAKLGLQSDDDLVLVAPGDMGTHTAIVAQSGSGKSFFLGRLIEELLLCTRAKCVILDPNADFIRVGELDTSLWDSARYDPDTDSGKLPTEGSLDLFSAPWTAISKRILTAPKRVAGAREAEASAAFSSIRLWWLGLSIEQVAEGVSGTQLLELHYCHEIARIVNKLIRLRGAIVDAANDVGAEWQTPKDAWTLDIRGIPLFYSDWRSKALHHTELTSTSEILLEHLALTESLRFQTLKPEVRQAMLKRGDAEAILAERIDWSGEHALNNAAIALAGQASGLTVYAPDEAMLLYLSYYDHFLRSGFAEGADPASLLQGERLTVVDLPSIDDKRLRLLVIASVLDEVWRRARADWTTVLAQPANADRRVPTFVVIDEAHNIAVVEPQEPLERVVRDQLRTIAAEGRKYGLFLILVSQRPDKLDPLILSECDNKALMRLDSERVLSIAEHLLGLEDVPRRLLERCLEFNRGRVLVAGRWARGDARPLYCAARRTAEGGRSLRDEAWTFLDPAVVEASQRVANGWSSAGRARDEAPNGGG